MTGWQVNSGRTGWQVAAGRTGWQIIAGKAGWEVTTGRTGWQVTARIAWWQVIAGRTGGQVTAGRKVTSGDRTWWQDSCYYPNRRQKMMTRDCRRHKTRTVHRSLGDGDRKVQKMPETRNCWAGQLERGQAKTQTRRTGRQNRSRIKILGQVTPGNKTGEYLWGAKNDMINVFRGGGKNFAKATLKKLARHLNGCKRRLWVCHLVSQELTAVKNHTVKKIQILLWK